MNAHSISKALTTLSVLVFLFFSFSVQAGSINKQHRSFINKDQDYKRLMGITTGIGQIKTNNEGSGTALYANFFIFWFNLSAEFHEFNDRSTYNTYTGVGLGRYFQFQYGYGDEGYLIRARSEIEIYKKITFYLSRERYREKPYLDNYSAGFGYNF
ncbi:MAG: hypothetical protein OEY52_14080 [Gammaproteobacteria bacterium]|nr:hypothetical protein [Gammaproteobacteria bacterium]